MEAMINGIKLHYIDTGNPEALPIVLIHGMTFDHRSWNPQIELLKQNYRVIAYDIRGHGKTDIVDGQYTYKMFVNDLISLLDYLEINKAVLCGLSMGGGLLQYAHLRCILIELKRSYFVIQEAMQIQMKRNVGVKIL